MKNLVYLLSGVLFGLGLSLSGMIDPSKVKGFLAVGTADWNPALVFVLGSAVPVYLISFLLDFRPFRPFVSSFPTDVDGMCF